MVMYYSGREGRAELYPLSVVGHSERLISSSGPFVAFGYKFVDRNVKRLGGYDTLEEAKHMAENGYLSHNLAHVGVAKVTHPQEIWFYRGGRFVSLDKELIFDVLALLGV